MLYPTLAASQRESVEPFEGWIITSVIREHVLLESSLSSEGLLTFGTDKDLAG